MLNILCYIGMSLQSEVCLWTLLGLLRTIFDATLFKVNANLKQVWQMKMPVEMSLPVQRALRTMISGVMLVQCFTVYVYLASYIVLLYPVFLEERPTLVLPWLLLAAVRNLLCELTSLALGLGTCVLLGPARPPCIRFVIIKIGSIMPALYMWMLIFGYYHNLKMASAFKTFPAVLPAKDLDYGLELAVRRRRTKSLQGEDQLRKKLIASLYSEQTSLIENPMTSTLSKIDESNKNSPLASNEDIKSCLDTQCPLSVTCNRTMSDIGAYEDWFGSEVVVPRDTDRILEQFVLMLLRIGAFLKKENIDPDRHFNSSSQAFLPRRNIVECTAMPSEETDTPPLVGSSKGKIASYLRDYPQIFMKKPSDIFGSLNTPDNRHMVKSSSSSQSLETPTEASLDSARFKKKTTMISSNTFIHSQEEIGHRYTKNTIKDIENLGHSDSKKEQKQIDTNNTKVNLATSIESVIDRMKARAALQANENNNVTDMKTAESSLRLNKGKRKVSISSTDTKILNKEKSSRNTSKPNKSNTRYRNI